MSNKVYDKLKWIAQILLPALAALWFGIGSKWEIPYTEQIVGTITSVDAFLGIILGISTVKYNKTNKNTPDEQVDNIIRK